MIEEKKNLFASLGVLVFSPLVCLENLFYCLSRELGLSSFYFVQNNFTLIIIDFTKACGIFANCWVYSVDLVNPCSYLFRN